MKKDYSQVAAGSLISNEKCSRNGQLIVHDDCSKYYQCQNNNPIIKVCSPGTFFNPSHSVCDWPVNVGKIRPECLFDMENTTPLVPITINATRTGDHKDGGIGYDYEDFLTTTTLAPSIIIVPLLTQIPPMTCDPDK